MQGAERRKLEDNKTPTARMAQIGPIDAKQCPKCHTIYPQMEGKEVMAVCVNRNVYGCHQAAPTRDIKVTIHYGEEGAF